MRLVRTRPVYEAGPVAMALDYGLTFFDAHGPVWVATHPTPDYGPSPFRLPHDPV
jgi:hypothetical protein